MFRESLKKYIKFLWQFFLGAGGWLFLASLASADPTPWLLVDTSARNLFVIQDGITRETFRNISVGRGGVADERYRGDYKTPRGEFRILWVNRNSSFRIFFGLDYPNVDYAKKALHAGRIDFDTYLNILWSLSRNRVPPQDTELGGFIGIHGLGRADPAIHRVADWTEGCIALTNEQIDRLTQWIQVGTRVVIH